MATDEDFRGFFAQHYERLCRLGFLLTGDPAQAEDLAQDALVRTWRRWTLVRRPDNPEAYARKVLLNRHRSLLRRTLVEARYRSRHRPNQASSDEHREDAIVLWAATRRLPQRQGAVLVLRYYEDLSEAEIARVLGIPVGTVKTLARRGLARLRRSLDAPPRATRSAARSDHDTGTAAPDAYERAAEWAPVSPGAYDRFLRRRARRGRMLAATAGLALVAVLGAAVLVARQLPQERELVAPAGEVVRVPTQGFELPVPAGWKVQRQLTGPGSQVVGVVLVPSSGKPRGASITVAADPDQPPFYTLDLQTGARRRADGRMYKLRPGANAPARPPLLKGGVGRYVIAWPAWPPSCRPLRVPAGQPPTCARAAWRVLLVTGVTAPGDTHVGCARPAPWPGCEQVLGVMNRIVGTVRPIGNAVPPPGAPPTMVPLGKGGSGAAAWEAGIELNIGPIQGKDGSAGFMVRFPRATPTPVSHWEQVEPWVIRHGGVYTQRECLSWLPGSGLLLSGLAREEVASVRIELAGRAPVTVATFGRDQPVPWVAFVSPPLPADTRLDQVVVVALDAAGKTVGTRQRPFSLPWSPPSCRPRAG